MITLNLFVPQCPKSKEYFFFYKILHFQNCKNHHFVQFLKGKNRLSFQIDPWWFQKLILLEIFNSRQSTKNHATICINQIEIEVKLEFWSVSTPKNAASRTMCYKLIGHMTSKSKKGEIKQLTPTFDTGNRIQLNKTMYWFIDFNKKNLVILHHNSQT